MKDSQITTDAEGASLMQRIGRRREMARVRQARLRQRQKEWRIWIDAEIAAGVAKCAEAGLIAPHT